MSAFTERFLIIVIGKGNISHMNAMYGSDIPNGWTPRGGKGKSTYGGGYDPSGSSSGCAVGVSAGFAAAAIAVETCGSIVSWDRQHSADLRPPPPNDRDCTDTSPVLDLCLTTVSSLLRESTLEGQQLADIQAIDWTFLVQWASQSGI